MLVAFAASVQGHEPTALQVEAWHELLADVDYVTAQARARAHFRHDPRPLWPADVMHQKYEESGEVEAFAAQREEWLRRHGITYDEYLENVDEPGWLESIERRVSS